MNQILSSKLTLPFSMVAIVVVIGAVFLLNQSSEPQPPQSPNPTPVPSPTPTLQPISEVPDEGMVIALIETLPDIKLLRGIPLQKDAGGITIRVVEQPQGNSQYFIVEVWEDLSGDVSLFQRYRYDISTTDLLIDLPLNPSEFDIFTHSALDRDTGEVVAVIDKEKKEECAKGAQLILNFCAGREAYLASEILKVTYQRILIDSKISQETKSVLIESQKQWTQEKDERCAPKLLESGQYDGSIQPLLTATCEESMTRERIDTLLNTYLKNEEG